MDTEGGTMPDAATVPSGTASVIAIWRGYLTRLLRFYEKRRGSVGPFFAKLFLFFVVVNIACYWLALGTAFPERALGDETLRYVMIQFPVGVLGALFDSLSFFVTVLIVRNAVASTTNGKYLGHLSIDFVIACLATAWVLLVFWFSGWLVDLLGWATRAAAAPMPVVEENVLAQRAIVYQERVTNAVTDPIDPENVKNIYFGIVMGVSAMIPTMVHLSMSVVSVTKWMSRPSN